MPDSGSRELGFELSTYDGAVDDGRYVVATTKQNPCKLYLAINCDLLFFLL